MRKNVVAIVQARMGSTRLPGKVLMNIVGRPMLWHISNRLKKCTLVDKIVVASTINKEDSLIEEFCNVNLLDCYRGSVDDVLDRYYQTAKFYRADVIVRITADCPLVDPEIVGELLSGYLKDSDNLDGASNVINRLYPRGLDAEVISFSALTKIWEQAKDHYQREHVTVYLYEHKKEFKLYSLESNRDLSHLRWTVDEEKDFKFVEEIYKRLNDKNRIFLMEDVLKVIEKEPYLLEINRDIKQKSLKDEGFFNH